MSNQKWVALNGSTRGFTGKIHVVGTETGVPGIFSWFNPMSPPVPNAHVGLYVRGWFDFGDVRLLGEHENNQFFLTQANYCGCNDWGMLFGYQHLGSRIVSTRRVQSKGHINQLLQPSSNQNNWSVDCQCRVMWTDHIVFQYISLSEQAWIKQCEKN